MLIDTHAHIHFEQFRDDLDGVLERAHAAGVEKMLVVGVNDLDSGDAIAVARAYDNLWATAGLHPHDHYKSETDPDDQERALRFQIELGLERGLPMIFHVRDAFDDFFRILDDFEGVRGLVHSFTAGVPELEGSLDRGLYIALNGIMTFTKDERQLEAARRVPLERLVLETDSPFLAPQPVRGQVNEPAHIAHTAAFLAELRGQSLEDLEHATSANAERLFGI
jgi:TatD DNase family protein